MAASVTFSTTAFGSIPASGKTDVTVTGEVSTSARPDVPAAKNATLSTRTNATSGTLTMTTGHGLTTGNRCDIYWTNTDGTEGKCYGAVLGTVPAAPGDTAVPVASVAGGDDLPPQDTAVIICKCVQAPLVFDGDNAVAIVAQAPQSRGYFVFHDGTYNLNAQHVSVGGMYYWYDGLDTNPLAGKDITSVFVSHNNVSQTIGNGIVSVITGD